MTTSEREGCYVYIQLPGSFKVVTCGRYALDALPDAGSIGRFVYGRSYRANPDAVELDKFELPLKSGTFETARLRGIFGALRDSSPDAWGRRVIERELGRTHLTELDFLLQSPHDRAGALSFGLALEPPSPLRKFNPTLALPELLAAAERVADDADIAAVHVEGLLDAGTSMGGARPKNVVEHDDALWLAKFPMRDDRWNNAPVEAAMLALARVCGIRTPDTRVVAVAGKDVLLVKRFDRDKVDGRYLRHRMVSALTLLRSDDEPAGRENWSYLRIADELRRWVGNPDQALHELFRRVVFNALICNIDDHPRNHALIAPGRAWMLSPAYDLTPTPVISRDKRDLALEAGAFNRYANRENLLSECRRFRVQRDEAGTIIDAMKATVGARWREFVQREGGTQRDCEAIALAFDYPGFEYDPLEVLA